MIIDPKHKKIIEQLFLIAQDSSNHPRSKLAACIVYKKEIISYGINRIKTHPFQLNYGMQTRHTLLNTNISEFKAADQKFSLNIHAETDAIRNALKRITLDKLSKCILYVVRAKQDDKGNFILGLAKPCGSVKNGCTKAIFEFGLKNVFYSTNEQTIQSFY